MWRALALGCIPVTFFRAAELPFARRLGLDYSRFVVNVQPDDYRGLQASCLTSFLQHRCILNIEGISPFPQLRGALLPQQPYQQASDGCVPISCLLGPWQSVEKPTLAFGFHITTIRSVFLKPCIMLEMRARTGLTGFVRHGWRHC